MNIPNGITKEVKLDTFTCQEMETVFVLFVQIETYPLEMMSSAASLHLHILLVRHVKGINFVLLHMNI